LSKRKRSEHWGCRRKNNAENTRRRGRINFVELLRGKVVGGAGPAKRIHVQRNAKQKNNGGGSAFKKGAS